METLIITTELLAIPDSKEKKACQTAALYDGRHMSEVTVMPKQGMTDSILNNIYAARVQNVVASLNAAFVEIEKGKVCYLPLEDLKHPVFTKKMSKKKEIAAGDELAVQVVREAVKSKDPVVTANLNFPGEYLVLTTGVHRLGVSSKVSGDARARLLKLAKQLKADHPPVIPQHKIENEVKAEACSDYGIILRTNAAAAAESVIQEEFKHLYQEYWHLVSTANTRTVYSCLRKEQPFYMKLLMDIQKSKLEEVITDDAAVFEQLSQSAYAGNCRIRFYEDRLLPLARLYQISSEIEKALQERVWLKSGANIIIQPTEALTVIDVNSGKNVARKNKTDYHYKINLEAAEEIARQLRLRNLSGIILIDFIDLYDEALNESLLSALRQFFKQDPVPTQLVDMTKLGLVEVTRKKIKKSLREMLL